MNADKRKEQFIEEVCLKVQEAEPSNSVDDMLTAYVDYYGAKYNLTLCEMDSIQNEIYKRLDL